MPEPSTVGAVVNSGINMAKAGFNWLRAKNDKFEVNPEAKKALESATNQANLGLGVGGFNTGVNQIKAQADITNQKINQNLYSSGLENSFAVRDTKTNVQKVTMNQIANLAFKIAEQNKNFRRDASARKENIQLQIDSEKRAFEENRKDRLYRSAFAFITATADTGLKAYSAKKSFEADATEKANLEKIEKEIPRMDEYSLEIDRLFETGGDPQQYIQDLEVSKETESALIKILLDLYRDK